LLDAANQHQEPLELGVIAIALPEVDELADLLEIAYLVVPGPKGLVRDGTALRTKSNVFSEL
jgi:hypothetical protein